MKGVASKFSETLHPREADHRVIIRARGEAEGRAFRFVVTDILHDARQVSIIWTEKGR